MKLFLCICFRDRYNRENEETAALAFAEREEEGWELIDAELKKRGLPGLNEEDQLFNLDTSKQRVWVFSEGDGLSFR